MPAILMIVNNLDVKRLIIDPAKAETPLIINADAVLPRTIPAQELKTISR